MSLIVEYPPLTEKFLSNSLAHQGFLSLNQKHKDLTMIGVLEIIDAFEVSACSTIDPDP